MLIITHNHMLEHNAGPGHPERPDRLRAATAALRQSGLPLNWKDAAPVDQSDLQRIHTPEYLQLIDSAAGKCVRLDEDTATSEQSVAAARFAAGAVVEAALAVVTGSEQRALALVRPPGHHALAHRAMGFCLYSNVAIAAARAIHDRLASRVVVIDFDVHHGNGTQAIFEDRADVLLISLQQSPLWPGTGEAEEIGRDAGAGYTVNIPLPPGSGDDVYADAFARIVTPVVDQFEPGLILISAGFDAHRDDPLAQMGVTEEGFGGIARAIAVLADRHTSGRFAVALEGGYNLTALSNSLIACAAQWTRAERDPGLRQPPTQEVDRVIARLRAAHGSRWNLGKGGHGVPA